MATDKKSGLAALALAVPFSAMLALSGTGHSGAKRVEMDDISPEGEAARSYIPIHERPIDYQAPGEIPQLASSYDAATEYARANTPFMTHTLAAARRHNVADHLAAGIVGWESSWVADQTSSAGARGLTQMKQAALDDANKACGTSYNITDTLGVLDAGMCYFSQLQERFGSEEAALIAYKEGPTLYTTVQVGNATPTQLAKFERGQRYAENVLELSNRLDDMSWVATLDQLPKELVKDALQSVRDTAQAQLYTPTKTAP